jgi:hypothetical protein
MSLRPYFAWGYFSIFLFKAANEAFIELATADVAFWQNEPYGPFLAKRTQSALPASARNQPRPLSQIDQVNQWIIDPLTRP